jgi:hypothetical protein
MKTTPRPLVAGSPPQQLARGPRVALQIMASLVCLSFGAVALLSSRRVAPDDGRLPEMIPINLDGSYMRWIGKTADGSQFLFSNAFIQDGSSGSATASVNGRRYFTTFYLFAADGTLQRSQIDEIGEGSDKTTALAALEKVKTIREKHIASLGRVKYGPISVRPFQVQHQGVAFGLIGSERPGKSGGPSWQVTLQPGSIVTFRPPWNGDYGQ